MNPTGAIMGQSRYKVAPPAPVSGNTEDKNSVASVTKREDNDLANLASLSNHPGWGILEAKMQKRIEAYKSGSYLVDAVGSNKPTSELGELLKIEMKVAASLAEFIREVTSAYTTVETQKEDRRNAARATRRTGSN